MQHVPSPPLGQPRDLRQPVDQPRGHQQPVGLDRATAGQMHPEPVAQPLQRGDRPSSTRPPNRATSARPASTKSPGAISLRVRYEWIPAAGALRGAPASTTSTERRARAKTTAPDRPAAPPPTTTTS
ncbi:hypothetical protein GCM10029992_44680 [Glycomyces albus]